MLFIFSHISPAVMFALRSKARNSILNIVTTTDKSHDATKCDDRHYEAILVFMAIKKKNFFLKSIYNALNSMVTSCGYPDPQSWSGTSH